MQTRLAKASLTPVERRNPDNNYNKIPISEVQQLTPNFVWADYIAARDTPAVTEINIAPPKFFKEVNAMITGCAGQRMEDISSLDGGQFLRFNACESLLPTRISISLESILTGKRKSSRVEDVRSGTDGDLGEALGMEYAKVKFTPEMKHK